MLDPGSNVLDLWLVGELDNTLTNLLVALQTICSMISVHGVIFNIQTAWSFYVGF